MKEEQNEGKKALSKEELAQVAGGYYENIYIDESRCIGCKACYDMCPTAAIVMSNDKARVAGDCVLCGACADVCPTGAITVS